MRAFYNDNDPFVCAWLQNLMDAGHITPGEIDDRSIVDIDPAAVAGFERAHFFASFGGWEHALNIAGWQGPVWTGSCPCQPLSSAGQRKGHVDERHLWPAFHRLIAECRPPVIFGEQVASKDGREWFAAVRADLEHVGYACGAADMPAAGVGAPHIRQRLWWVGESDSAGRPERREAAEAARHGSSAVAAGHWLDAEFLECADGKARPTQPGLHPLAHGIPGRVGRLRAYGNAIVPQVAAEFVQAFLEASEGAAP